MANHPNRSTKKQTLALTREEWTVVRKALDLADIPGAVELSVRIAAMKIMHRSA